MKNNKLAKISLLILSVALILGMMFAMSINAEETAVAKPVIISQNIEYSKDFRLMYAVDAATATGPVELYVYAEEPTVETAESYIKKYTVETVTPASETGNLGKDAFIFTTDGVSYTAMADQFYVQAVDTATGAKSDIKRYSVAEYLYERLAKSDATAEQKELYNSTIAFGTNMQKVLNGETDANKLISNLRYVTVEGGDLEGYNAGVYPIGSTIAPKFYDPIAIGAIWNVTTYAADGTSASADVNSAFKVTDAVKIEAKFVESVVLTYREQAKNYDDIAPGTEFTADYGDIYDEASASFVSEEGRGTVIKVDYPKASSQFIFNTTDVTYYNAGLATEDTATAYEFSFDIKMEFPDGVTGQKYVMPRIEKGKSRIYRIGLFQGFTHGHDYFGNPNGVSTDRLFIGHDGEWSWKAYSICEAVDPTDWFHVRIVVYDGDPQVYVHINGSKDPSYILDTPQSNFKEGDISGITRVMFMANTAGTSIYLDNVFASYTMDTKPTEPDEGGETNPDQGGETAPDQGGTTTPDQGGTTTPDQGGTTTPDQGGETTPDQGGETTGPVYTTGYNNLNDLTEVPSCFEAQNTSNVPGLLSDTNRGNYINMDMSSPEGKTPYFKVYPDAAINGEITKENATAFEVSFDLKMASPASTSKDANQYILFGFMTAENKTVVAVYLYTWHTVDSANNTLRIITSTGAVGDTAQVANVDTTDWYHVRFVVYEGDNRLFIYINGSSTPVTYTIDTSRGFTYDDLSYFRFGNGKNYTENTSVSIDNVFCGYINETTTPDEGGTTTPDQGGETTGPVYTTGYNNLNDLTEVPSCFEAQNTSNVPGLLSDTNRGNYINMDMSSPEGKTPYFKVYPDAAINGEITKENATAFEVSFDVKLTSPASTSKDANQMMLFGLMTAENKTVSSVYLYTWHKDDSANNALRIITSTGATGDTAQVANVDTTDWYHVRFVVYKGDNRMFIYINQSSTPVIYTISSAYTFDDVGYLRIGNAKNYTENTSVSIDNVFCGYTNEANPDSANAVVPASAE